MRWFIRAIYLSAALLVLAFFHYTLPQRDIVRIIGTEVVRMDVQNGFFWAGKDAGTDPTTTRDVRFINAVYANGKTMEFRNEDTGWGWPPYFKFDSGELQAQAQLNDNNGDAETWVALRHYGWRFSIRSIYPNALSMKVVDGPDVQLIPWFNIIFLTVLGLTLFAIWRRVDRWKGRHVDPVIEGVGSAIEDVGDSVSERRAGLSRWLGTWRKKS